jgi:molybdate transport system substrate-binding protein
VKLLLVLLALVTACDRGNHARLAVGAAAVTRHAMPDLVARYHELTGNDVTVVYGASDRLAQQANDLDVLVLAEPGAFAGAAASAPVPIATTSLVLLGPDRDELRFANLATNTDKLAIGDPGTVPVGRYARTFLQQLGAWDAVSSRLVLGGDVAGVLALAQRGTARAAIVYATDALDAAPLVILDRATGGPVVTIATAATIGTRAAAEARRFVEFLQSPDARTILRAHRFGDVVR